MNRRKALFDASPWLTTIGFFVLWELVCRLFKIPPFILPSPSQAVAALVERHAIDTIVAHVTSGHCQRAGSDHSNSRLPERHNPSSGNTQTMSLLKSV